MDVSRVELPLDSVWRRRTTIMLYIHVGVSNENRTHDSGITTRGFATKLWTPYRNTFGDMLKVSLDDPKSLCFRMCFYMVGPQGFEPWTGRLKVCCDNHFTITPYGPSGGSRTHTSRIKSPACCLNISKGWFVKIVFYVPSQTIQGARMTLRFTSFHVIILKCYE